MSEVPDYEPKELYMWSSRMTIALIPLDQTTLQPLTDSEGEIQLIPVDSVTNVCRAPKLIQDDIDQPNCGIVDQPHRYTFTVTMSANSDGAKWCKYVLRENAVFHIVIKETDVENDNYSWVSKVEQFLFCKLDNETQTIVTDNVPRCTFTGIALRHVNQGLDPLKAYD